MKTSLLLLTTLALGGLPALRAADESGALVARGEYIVKRVGLCSDCHAPRNERGEFITAQWLKGSALPFAPTVPMPAWANAAPGIAGLPTMTSDQAVNFLMTGVRPDGSLPRPPMPPFRMDQADARAVVAYLKSLQP